MCFSHSFGEESFGKYLFFFPWCFLRGMPGAGFAGDVAAASPHLGFPEICRWQGVYNPAPSLLSEEGMPPSNTHQKPVLEEGSCMMRCV